MEKSTRAATGRDSDKYIVRFPDGMRDQIAADAKRNNRTMNAEIIERLQGRGSDNSEVVELLTGYAVHLQREIEDHRFEKSALAMALETAIVYLKGGLTADDDKVAQAIVEWQAEIDKFALELNEQGEIVEGRSSLIQEVRAKVADVLKGQ